MANDINISTDVIKTEEMKRYESNMKTIKIKYPNYYDLIDKCEINKKYMLTKTGKSDQYNVYNIEKNEFLYDLEEPMLGPKKQLDKLKLKNAKLVVYLGYGMGYQTYFFTKYYANQQNSQGMIAIERDVELFKLALFFADISSMLNNKAFLLVLGDEIESLLSITEKYIRVNAGVLYAVKTLKVIYYDKVIGLNKEYYMSALKQIREVVKYILSYYGNDPGDSLIGLENILDNIKEIITSPGVNLLFDKFKKKPAIIVSTGPSLNKNKHLLKGIEDKALIICPDASLKILLEMGVKPHLITALERVPLTAELVRGFTDDQLDGVYYAATPVVPNEAYQAYNGKYLMVYRNFNHFKWLGVERGILDIKQSSGNMAYKIADALGCDPIILIGQDLSYSEDGFTHAIGATLGDKQNVQPGEILVKANNGGMIKTNQIWNTFRQGYEIDVHQSNVRTINSTEGGAFIEGTEVMPLSESLEKYVGEEFFPRDQIGKLLSVFSADNIHDDLDRISKIYKNTQKDLNDMLKHCYDGVVLIQGNKAFVESILNSKDKIDRKDKYKIEKLHEQIIKHKEKITKNEPTMSMYLMHIVQAYYISFEIMVNGEPDLYEEEMHSKSAVILKHENFFAMFYKMIEISRDLLVKSNEKLETLRD
ncbi:MAG: 6-hydroxymethylpterin diphosphokinase MptE-like protein [Acidaminobacteraceae bacterium]